MMVIINIGLKHKDLVPRAGLGDVSVCVCVSY